VYGNGHHGIEIYASYYIIEGNEVFEKVLHLKEQAVYIFTQPVLRRTREITTSFATTYLIAIRK
jgi:hypothetical protein